MESAKELWFRWRVLFFTIEKLDMFNHYYDKVGQTFWRYEDKDDSFNVTAQRVIPAGEPICENYGVKPNYRFLFYYGFVIENNRKNCVYIKLFLNKDDPLTELKRRLVGITRKGYIKQFKFFDYFNENEKTDNKFLGYLRFIEFSGDLNSLVKYITPSVDKVEICHATKRKLRMPAISLDNEEKMLEKLKMITEKCLKKYPQTYEEDLRMLEDPKLSFNRRNTLIFRSGEKKVQFPIAFIIRS